MKTAKLIRLKSCDEGTFGEFASDTGFRCVTGELPWRDNHNGKSCIPVGEYVCEWLLSPSKGMCYHLKNVPGRDSILIHAANLCGDVDKGFQTELLGCIAPGISFGDMNGQKCVKCSKTALRELEAHFLCESFLLEIV